MTTPADRSTPTSLDPVEVAGHVRISTARLTRVLRQNDDSGLGPTIIAALATVAREGPLTLGELAAAEQVAPPTITKVANKLVERGLVSRQVDPADRRVVRLEATDAGRKQLEAYRKRRTSWLAARLRNCTPEELATLDEAMRIIDRLTGATGDVR